MILVTGGAGFIGSHIVDALLERGHAVRVLDALLPAAHRERPDYLDPRAELIEGDVRDGRAARRRDRGLPSGGDGRARRGPRRHHRVRGAQRPRDRGAAARARPQAAAARAGLEHGRLRRGALPLRRARDRAAGAARAARPRRRASSSRPARAAAAPWSPKPSRRTRRWTRATSTRRRRSRRSTCAPPTPARRAHP